MLKYLHGIINENVVPFERTLSVTVSPDENGQPLLEHINIMAETYKKHISCICLIGGTQDQHELVKCFKEIHKYKLKTALWSHLKNPDQLINSLADELDYLKLDNTKFLKKDCIFDLIDWIDI